jgi:hypothetical protein
MRQDDGAYFTGALQEQGKEFADPSLKASVQMVTTILTEKSI